MGTSDGSVIGTTKVVDHGADTERWNLVVLGDGFTAAEQTDYGTAVTDVVAKLQSIRPFDDLWSRINVHRVDVQSNQSGADNPADCPDGSAPAGGATSAATFFDAAYCNSGIRRLLIVDAALVVTTANAQVPDWDAILVVVNHTEYGGSGGQVGVFSLAPGAVEIALHEMGHSAFGLADEYQSFVGCGIDTDRDHHPGPEPLEPNVTTVTDRATLKWRQLVDGATALPTMANPDCTQCDTRPSTVPTGTVGLFEGAHYHHCGAYRPEYDCLMRTVGADLPFCAVCQDAIRQRVVAGSTAPPMSDCYVAGAVYGDGTHPDVEWLRSWRDRHLAGGPGRPLMRGLGAVDRGLGPLATRLLADRPRLAGVLRDRLFAPVIGFARRRGDDRSSEP